jgi:phage terminase large subunit
MPDNKIPSAAEIHWRYAPLWESDSRYFILTGGRGSAKSFSAQSFICSLTFEPNHRCLITRYTMTSANLSVIPEFFEKIELMQAERLFDQSRSMIRNKLTGTEIIFKGIKTSSGNQTAALKSLTGITTWLLDEAEELQDEDTFDKIEESIRKKGVQNRIIILLNPATKEHWIYKRFFEKAGVEAGWNGTKNGVTYIHTTYLDNVENLNETIIRKYEDLKTSNPKKYAHRVLGGWMDKAEGVIFEHWRYGEFDTSLPVCTGLDFGFYPDPAAAVEVAIDKKRKLLFVKLLIYEVEMSTTLLERNLRTLMRKPNQLIIADNSEPREISDLNKRGLNIFPCQKGPDSVIAGIKDLLEFEIIVDPQSTKIGVELNNYTWADKKSDTPIDDYNHAIDAIRYGYQGLTRPQRRLVAV